MHNIQIDGMITGNSYAPTVLAGLFMLLFIPYAYGAFLKKRKQEYALFLTLGMTQKEVILNMSAECLILSLSAGITGLLCGTGLSFFSCAHSEHSSPTPQYIWNSTRKLISRRSFCIHSLSQSPCASISFNSSVPNYPNSFWQIRRKSENETEAR